MFIGVNRCGEGGFGRSHYSAMYPISARLPRRPCARRDPDTPFPDNRGRPAFDRGPDARWQYCIAGRISEPQGASIVPIFVRLRRYGPSGRECSPSAQELRNCLLKSPGLFAKPPTLDHNGLGIGATWPGRCAPPRNSDPVQMSWRGEAGPHRNAAHGNEIQREVSSRSAVASRSGGARLNIISQAVSDVPGSQCTATRVLRGMVLRMRNIKGITPRQIIPISQKLSTKESMEACRCIP